MEQSLIEQASALPMDGGSLTFRMLVAQRDWEAVKEMWPDQRDAMHGVSTLTNADRQYLQHEASKDGYSLF